ncbi:MAG: hypothetical protein ABI772_15565 [Bacteroidota bacterium]
MKLKKLVSATLLIACFFNAKNLSAQTWNLTGNAATTTAHYLGTSDSKDLRFKTANVVRMTVKNSGKIGIGTASPIAAFHVFGNGEAFRINGLNSYIQLADGSNVLKSFIKNNNGDLQIGLSSVNTAGKLQLNTATGTQIEVSANGFTNFKAGYITVGNVNPAAIKQTGNDLNLLPYSPSSGTPGNLILATPSGLFKAGNVGIGTALPTVAKLLVEGSVGNTIALFRRTATGDGVSLIGDAPGIYFNMYYNSGQKAMTAGYGSQIYLDKNTGTMGFGVTTASASGAGAALTSGNALLINSLGNVGINYFGGPSTLDVKLKSGTSATASFWGTNAGFASHFCYGTNEDTYIRGGKTTSNVIIADLTNNVGIGTANPLYKLDVCGNIRAKEVRVSTGWCDYVFADDYILPALSDVEDFIKTNKHLPEVTPGALIESEGLEVGKTSAQMIKKIEELTLYVIDLQKQVDALRKNTK